MKGGFVSVTHVKLFCSASSYDTACDSLRERERKRERGLVDQSWEMIKIANLLLAIEANRYRLRSLNGSSKYDMEFIVYLLWMCPVPTGTAPVIWSQWCHWWCDNLQQMKTSLKLY